MRRCSSEHAGTPCGCVVRVDRCCRRRQSRPRRASGRDTPLAPPAPRWSCTARLVRLRLTACR